MGSCGYSFCFAGSLIITSKGELIATLSCSIHTATSTTTPTTMAITYPPIFKATFRIREAYGNTRAYPVSREAVLLCQLTGNKTLRGQEISTIRELGFECVDTDGHLINAVDLY
jgi:hypothetical protein